MIRYRPGGLAVVVARRSRRAELERLYEDIQAHDDSERGWQAFIRDTGTLA